MYCTTYIPYNLYFGSVAFKFAHRMIENNQSMFDKHILRRGIVMDVWRNFNIASFLKKKEREKRINKHFRINLLLPFSFGLQSLC